MFTENLFFFNDTATTEIYTLSLHDALPIYKRPPRNSPHQNKQTAGDPAQICSRQILCDTRPSLRTKKVFHPANSSRPAHSMSGWCRTCIPRGRSCPSPDGREKIRRSAWLTRHKAGGDNQT